MTKVSSLVGEGIKVLVICGFLRTFNLGYLFILLNLDGPSRLDDSKEFSKALPDLLPVADATVPRK